jgi:hypothetical protein
MRKHLKKPSPAMGIALIALFIALGGTTYAATGGNFILGQANTATNQTSLSGSVNGATTGGGKVLQLTNTSTGAGATALGLTVASGKPPLAVNSGTKVANLNVDKIDNLDSSAFARNAQEPWHEVGTPGQPPFLYSPTDDPTSTEWQNYGFGFNTAAFFKDSLGIVHLKGIVRWTRNAGLQADCDYWTIFQLPVGYRPALWEILPAFKNSQPTRIDVGNNGWVYLCTPAGQNTIKEDWFSLDGMTFRAAN